MATRWHPGSRGVPHGTPVINGPAVYGSGVSTITILAYIINISLMNGPPITSDF